MFQQDGRELIIMRVMFYHLFSEKPQERKNGNDKIINVNNDK